MTIHKQKPPRNDIVRPATAAVSGREAFPVTPPKPSEEEIERRVHRMQKIEPVYWERAPVLLEEIFKEENTDVGWTMQVKESIEQALSSEILRDTRLQFSECHRSLCKAVVRHKDEDAYNTFKEKGADLGPWTGNLHGKKDMLPNGEIATTVYFSRAGDNSPFEKMKDRMLEMVARSRLDSPHPGHRDL